MANPDFEDRISDVAVWLLEFEDENSTPDREIGLDSTAHVIVKMPYKRNYGYWTDNNLKLPDFQSQFKTELISKEQFDERWSSAFDE